MNAYFLEKEGEEPYKSTVGEEARAALCRKIHLLKTTKFQAMIESGALPLRPGVAKLVGAPTEYSIASLVHVSDCCPWSVRLDVFGATP
jgi:hypothetical protein